jgi:hypothetical protein
MTRVERKCLVGSLKAQNSSNLRKREKIRDQMNITREIETMVID